MLVTTTSVIEGGRITRYFGIVSGETIIGANVFQHPRCSGRAQRFVRGGAPRGKGYCSSRDAGTGAYVGSQCCDRGGS